MYLKMMKILNFIRKKFNKKTYNTNFSDYELENKKRWLEGDGPQTD